MSLFAKPYTAIKFSASARSLFVSNALGNNSPSLPAHTPTAFAASTNDGEFSINSFTSSNVYLTARAHPGEGPMGGVPHVVVIRSIVVHLGVHHNGAELAYDISTTSEWSNRNIAERSPGYDAPMATRGQ